MRTLALIATLLAVCTALAGCSRRLHENDVREFIDTADNAARKRFAPDICSLRGKDFTLHLTFHGHQSKLEPTEVEMDRKLFCKEAGKFSRLYQYLLERRSIEIDMAGDRRTARVTSNYVETLPYYEPDMMPRTPDDFFQFQVVETRDESVVGFEGGDLKFLSTDAESHQTLVAKTSVNIPYQ
ncbi:MAG TPA: hypothetical protein VGO61_15490 [Steroidobacteraceae bacterium]|jgi:hypothetical protein|nr:hypothetical protein [Steroidobacteraceae bacterium]